MAAKGLCVALRGLLRSTEEGWGKSFWGGVKISGQKVWRLWESGSTFALQFRKRRAFSSAGLEHLPYKQRVGGPNPSTPTKREPTDESLPAFGLFKSQEHCRAAGFGYICGRMKKRVGDFRIADVVQLAGGHALLRIDVGQMEIRPGQFVQVQVPGGGSPMLRRPISVNDYDRERGLLDLLVQPKGTGTRKLAAMQPGESLNVVLPLGSGFTMPAAGERMLLIGGGVGVAPLLYFGRKIKAAGAEPVFLLGARTAEMLLRLEDFEAVGRVCITTEDGSRGERGFVTGHPVLGESFRRWAVCGPEPMMKAVARAARAKGVECEVSLENKMACGLGACLCCVEKTAYGNLCVCTAGPVFNIDFLLWHK